MLKVTIWTPRLSANANITSLARSISPTPSEDEDDVCNNSYQHILDHRTVRKQHQILLEWESGERTWEPLGDVWKFYPYLLTQYEVDHDLVDKWDTSKRPLKKYAKRNKMLIVRMGTPCTNEVRIIHSS